MSPLTHATHDFSTAEHFEAASVIQDAWKTYITKKHTHIKEHFIPAWKKFSPFTHNHWKWKATNLNKTHPNPERKKFPKPIFNKDKSNKKHGGIKLKGLTQHDLIKLFTLGNPLLPEKLGGLKLKHIFIYIHNSGRDDVANSPKKFFSLSDDGHSLSMSFRRLWSIVNED